MTLPIRKHKFGSEIHCIKFSHSFFNRKYIIKTMPNAYKRIDIGKSIFNNPAMYTIRVIVEIVNSGAK